MPLPATCGNADCGAPLQPPLLQCARCKEVAYCSRACQAKAWKAGHKHECSKAIETRAPPANSASCDDPPACHAHDGEDCIHCAMRRMEPVRSMTEVARSGSQALRLEMVVLNRIMYSVYGCKSTKKVRLASDALERTETATGLFVAAQIQKSLGNERRHLELNKLASKKGSPSAGNQLGNHETRLAMSTRNRRHYKLAVKYYTDSALLGHPSSQHRLGVLNHIVDNDGSMGFQTCKREEAARWYTMAAKHGFASSLANLYFLIEDEGVPCPDGLDPDSMLKQAVLLGNEQAAQRLAGKLYPFDPRSDDVKLLVDNLWEIFAANISNSESHDLGLMLGAYYLPRDHSWGHEDPQLAWLLLSAAKNSSDPKISHSAQKLTALSPPGKAEDLEKAANRMECLMEAALQRKLKRTQAEVEAVVSSVDQELMEVGMSEVLGLSEAEVAAIFEGLDCD